jgi:hypothetical protein
MCSIVLAQDHGFLEGDHPFPKAPLLPVHGCTRTQLVKNHSKATYKSTKVFWDGTLDFTLSDLNPTVRLEVGTQHFPFKLKTMPMFLSNPLERDLNHDGRSNEVIKLA